MCLVAVASALAGALIQRLAGIVVSRICGSLLVRWLSRKKVSEWDTLAITLVEPLAAIIPPAEQRAQIGSI